MPWPAIQPSPGEVILDRNHHINQGLLWWWLFNEKGGITLHDYSGFGNHGVLTNMVPADDWVVSGDSAIAGHALDFNGSDNYVTKPTTLFTGTPLTISAWVNIRSGVSRIAGVYVTGQSRVIGLIVQVTSGVAIAQHFDGTQALAQGTTNLFNDWHYITGVFESDASRSIYVDGVLEGVSTIEQISIGTIDRFTVGRNELATPGEYTDGLITNVRVLNRAWNENEVMESYINPYVGIWRRRKTYFVPAVVGGTILPQIISSYYRTNA